jgi:sigma-B regulation protein RsbU (phosphoserine phosphatase)
MPSEDIIAPLEVGECLHSQIAGSKLVIMKSTGHCPNLSAPGELIGKRFSELLNMAGRIFYETHFAPLLRMQGFFNEVALDLVTKPGKSLPVLVNAAERRIGAAMSANWSTRGRRSKRAFSTSVRPPPCANNSLRCLVTICATHGNNRRRRAANGDTTERPRPEMAQLIQGSAARMGGLIDDVMDFARGRLGGGLTLQRVLDAPIEPLLRQVVGELQTSAPQRPIKADFAIDAPVDCDPRRVGQLASSPLGNAEALEKIFEPFERGTLRSSLQGLGLGLYISSEIAKAHGGTLAVSSTAAEIRFTFRMPLTG